MKTLKTFGIVLLVATLVGVGGCAFLEPTGDVRATAQQLHETEAAAKENPLVTVHRGAYFNPTPTPLTQEYPWLKDRVTLNVAGPLRLAMRSAFEQAHLSDGMVPVEYDTGTPDDVQVNVSYSGDLLGYLNALKRATGYTYTIKDGTLTWYKFVTETFTILAPAGYSNWMIGDSQNSGQQQGGIGSTQGNSSQGSSNAVQTVTTNAIGHDDQYVNDTASDESVYKSIMQAVQTMLSKQGQVVPTAALGSITVRDYPQNVDRVAEYIQQINADLSREVYVTVNIIEINLGDNASYGINWNVVRNALGGNGSLSLTQGIGENSISSVTPGALLFSVNPGSNDLWAGSSLLLNALRTQGNASIATSPSIMAVNGRPSKIAIISQTGYLAAQSTFVTANVGAQVSLIPGNVISGFRMYILPRIQGDTVQMLVSSSLSSLSKLVTQQSNSSGSSAVIQTPDLDGRDVYMYATMRSGDTLVLAGYKQVTENKGRQSFFGIPFLGSESMDKGNTEILITITPVIVNGV